MRRLLRTSYLLALFLLIFSCEGLKNSAKNIFENSERAKYERRFSGADSLLNRWQKSFTAAVNNNLEIKDGFVSTINNNDEISHALGYSIDLKKGDVLIVETEKVVPGSKIFIDFMEVGASSASTESKKLDDHIFRKPIDRTGSHQIIIQPEIGYTGKFNLKIYTQPSLAFPVAGKDNADIQSFWDANRDGGARSHEGVDIFAKRGTPVIAAVNGMVTRTGNSGLGGKQVWLRDGILGNSLYYAHLDSIMSEGGQIVKIGDTLGTVGNTGNAEGGSPHLHFGIYILGGAVDPYPFIRKRGIPKFQTFEIASNKRTIKDGSNLRLGPDNNSKLVKTINVKTAANILAVTAGWSHIITVEGTEGFISNNRLE